MSFKITYTVKGEPQGKARPRVVQGGRLTYTPLKTKLYEAKVREVTKRIKHMVTGPIKLSITAVFGVPKSYSKKRRKRCLEGLERPTKKPDIDNISKIVLDGLNPVMKLNKATHHKQVWQKGLYEDDKQVVELSVTKIYGQEGKVVITAEELGDPS